MNRQERFDYFIERATKMHNGKFNYSKAIFTKYKDEILIICPKHGEFYQTPDKHLAKKSKGCQKCWEDIKGVFIKESVLIRKKNGTFKPTPPLSKEDFQNKCDKKFGGKFIYDFSNYNKVTGNKIKVTCPVHGEHEVVPYAHWQSRLGCYKCANFQAGKGKTKTYEFSIDELKIKHNYLYDYPEYNSKTYKNKRSKIDIICKIHGLFKKSVQKHLSGQGCYHCKIEDLIRKNLLVGGYNEELFQSKPELKNEPAILYYLIINRGKYYKIGISKLSCFNNRIKGIKSKAKKYNENIEPKILKITEKTLYECFLMEQKILNENDNVRIMRRWSTELFHTDIWDNIKNHFTPLEETETPPFSRA